MKKPRILLLAVLVVAVCAYFFLDLGEYISLEYLKSQQTVFNSYYATHPVRMALYFLGIYVAITGLSLPTAGILTLAGGTLFGLLWGTILVSFASTIGATLAFIASRYLLRNFIQDRYRDKLSSINAGIENDGNFYLLTLRLIPVFPYFLINILMGLTPIRTLHFYLISQIGMLPITIIYVNAGTQIARIKEPADILSAQLLFSFILIGLFPLLARRILVLIRSRRKQTGVLLKKDEQA